MFTENRRVDIDHYPLGNPTQLQAQFADFRERVHRLGFVAAVPLRGGAHFRWGLSAGGGTTATPAPRAP